MDNLVDLFQNNIKLTTFASKSWLNNSPEYLREDILAEARVGLWKACKTYNSSIGFTFSTYAVRVIFNQVGMFMRKQKRHSKVSSLDTYIVDIDEKLTVIDAIGYEHDFESDISYKSTIAKLNNYPITKRIVAGELQRDIAKSIKKSQSLVSKAFTRERKLLKAEL